MTVWEVLVQFPLVLLTGVIHEYYVITSPRKLHGTVTQGA